MDDIQREPEPTTQEQIDELRKIAAAHTETLDVLIVRSREQALAINAMAAVVRKLVEAVGASKTQGGYAC